jgi:uncharacterized protein
MTALRCNVSDLLHHPAARRAVHVEIPGSELGGVAGSRLSAAPLVVDLWLERISDGIVVHGTVAGEYESECSRCLAPVRATFELPVRELFERDVIEGETYPLEGEEIDLELPVRDTVLLDLPTAPGCARRAASTGTSPTATATRTRPIRGGTRCAVSRSTTESPRSKEQRPRWPSPSARPHERRPAPGGHRTGRSMHRRARCAPPAAR